MKKLLFILFAVFILTQCETDDDNLDFSGINAPNNYSENKKDNEKYEDYGENPFISAKEQPVSTFAIDADGGSYANMRRFSNNGQKPPAASIRIEEFLNYFNYDYQEPESGNVAINSEVFTCPWKSEHYVLRIGMKGKSLDSRPSSNFVFLIDVSGSMGSEDKLDLLKKGFIEYTNKISATDKIAIVTYAGNSSVVLESTYGDSKKTIKDAINNLGSGGGTAGADGIKTAYEIAEKNFIPGGNNRVILGTDGDFNIGISSSEELVKLIESKRESNVFLTVLGVGSGNLNDAMMEQLANHGNGNYEYIDNTEQLNKVFSYEYQKFFTIAKDCKVQVNFNPKAVASYRLIGYENRVLDNDDFENDSVDAGEIGASQTITALYEIIPATSSQEKFALIDFRYKKPLGSESIEINHGVPNKVVPFELATENSRFASCVAGLGLYLKDSEYKGNLTLNMVQQWTESAISFDPYGFRREFANIVNSYK